MIKTDPPGMVKISKNFYADKDEMTNFSYQEYLYWTGIVFGSKSERYLKALPDTFVWNMNYMNVNSPAYWEYFRYIPTRFYPLVGANYEQALSFSKWRSDRVMEFLLIRDGCLEWNPSADSTNCFTIEKWFNGEITGAKKKSKIICYPQYRLPSLEEWKLVASKKDSINKKWFKKPGFKKCKPDTSINYLSDDKIPKDPRGKTDPAELLRYCGCNNDRHSNAIQNLKGNLRELSNEKGVALGGSWNDSLAVILRQDTFHYEKPDAYTGFRNVCEWKVWKP
jgi:hypothetical protein